jgi:hypothetical protein
MRISLLLYTIFASIYSVLLKDTLQTVVHSGIQII